MTENITDRQEILFLYEARDCNPNGDPLDENRPRTDAETGQATVTDVRIKRTVRDYLHDQRSLEILIRDTFETDGTLRDAKGRCRDFIAKCGVAANGKLPEFIQAVQEQILSDCIDARLFGTTLPIEHGKKKSSIKITGPVQFSAFNRSMHAVSPVFIQQTAAFAGKPGKTQKSFAERWILPYALICCYGVINEVAAGNTHLTEKDMDLLLEGLWHGTNSLNTHSKMGHQSMLLVRIRHKPGYRIGALPERVRLQTEMEETNIRKSADYTVDITALLSALSDAADKVVGVDVIQDDRLVLTDEEQKGGFMELAERRSIPVSPLEF